METGHRIIQPTLTDQWSACHTSRGRGDRGYSLVEMLVAVSITGLVALAALPNTSTLFKKHALGGAVEQLAFEIARARMQAVGQNKYVRIYFYDQDTYGIQTSRDGVNYTLVGATHDLPHGIRVTSSIFPRFNRRGLATSPTTIKLSDGQSTRSIRINMLGNATVS